MSQPPVGPRAVERSFHRKFKPNATVARLAFGAMPDALPLGSARVHPARLLESGYAFRYPDLEPALRHLLGR